jgi:hypothetical protein
MEIMTARVVDGRLDLPDDALPEGAMVTLLVHVDGETDFALTEEQEAELTEAIAQANRGEGVDGWELLRELKG